MLKKLLKYDLFYSYKIIIIYYILSIIFALLTRIFWSFDATLFNIIGSICSGVTISLMINVLINTLIRNWARFNIKTNHILHIHYRYQKQLYIYQNL